MKATGMYARFAVVQFDYTDFVNGVFKPALVLPNQSLVLRGAVVITEASNAGGATDVIDLGTTAAPSANANDVNFKAVGVTQLTSLVFANGVTVGFTRAVAAGAVATAGKGYLYVEYISPEFCDFIVGDLPSP